MGNCQQNFNTFCQVLGDNNVWRAHVTHEGQLFAHNSPAFNRSKFLVLLTVWQMGNAGRFVGKRELLIASSVPYMTIQVLIPKWIKWRYLYWEDNKGYRTTSKGRRLISKLGDVIPDTVKLWITEQKAWRALLPPREELEQLTMPDLIFQLEGMRGHKIGSAWWLYEVGLLDDFLEAVQKSASKLERVA